MVLVAIAIVALWLGYPRDKAATANESLRVSTEERVTAQDTNPSIAGNPGKPLSENLPEQGDITVLPADISAEPEEPVANQNCQALEQALQSHPARDQFQDWYQKELSADLHDSYYQRLSMEELLQEAQAADIHAMRMLAEKYLRYALFQRYDQPDKQQQSTVLDRSALAQARYWAEQAALHGYGGAFLQLAEMYFVDWKDAERQLAPEQREADLDEQVNDTQLMVRAYLQLSIDVMPDLFDLLYPLREQLGNDKLSTEQLTRFNEMYPTLRSEWREKRAMLGLPAELEFNIPVEVEQYIQLLNREVSCANNSQ